MVNNMLNNSIREKILSWMREKGCFTMEDISLFLKTVSSNELEIYKSIFIDLLDSQAVSSMYNVYKLKV